MTNDEIMLALMRDALAPLKASVMGLTPKDRMAFLALVRELVSDYCPRCGEEITTGCVCVR